MRRMKFQLAEENKSAVNDAHMRRIAMRRMKFQLAEENKSAVHDAHIRRIVMRPTFIHLLMSLTFRLG